MLLRCGIDGAELSESALLAPGWLRPETLESLLELNEMTFALLAAQAAERCTPASALVTAVTSVWRRLDAAARRRAAACPYLLLDAGFADAQRWGGPPTHVSDVREAAAPFFSVPAALEASRVVFTYALAPCAHPAGRRAAAARHARAVRRGNQPVQSAPGIRARRKPRRLAAPALERAPAGVAGTAGRRSLRRGHGAGARPAPRADAVGGRITRHRIAAPAPACKPCLTGLLR